MSRRYRHTSRSSIGCLPVMIGLLTVLALGLVAAIVISRRTAPPEIETAVQEPAGGRYVDVSATAAQEELVLNAASVDVSEAAQQVQVTASPTPAPLPTLSSVSENSMGGAAPTPTAEGFMPIYKKANTEDMAIAITVDECNGVTITKNIALMARYYDAKLTLFPTGDNLMRKGMGSVLKTCVNELGFEIENRGYSTISQIYRLSDEQMCMEIWKQSIALSYVLGVDYQPHFLRLYGGNGEGDLRTHGYIKQLGYLGIASYTYNGNAMSAKKLVQTLAPGNIYMFKSTSTDAKKMSALMKAAKQAGYSMVTLNTLFGYAPNVIKEDSGNILAETMPVLGDYNNHFYFMKKGDCSWAVYQMQRRLVDLGYLVPGSADGVFGKNTSVVLSVFQAKCGLAATGAADVVTQQRLFSADAPEADVRATIAPAATEVPMPEDAEEGLDEASDEELDEDFDEA